MTAKWRGDIFDSYLKLMFVQNPDGTISPKWNVVEKIAKKDANDITPEEYEQLAKLYLKIDEKDIARLLGYCMTREDFKTNNYSEDYKEQKKLFNPNYSTWTVDNEKFQRIISLLTFTSDCTLYQMQQLKRGDEYDALKQQRNIILQRTTLLSVMQRINSFNGYYKDIAPKMTITKRTREDIIKIRITEESKILYYTNSLNVSFFKGKPLYNITEDDYSDGSPFTPDMNYNSIGDNSGDSEVIISDTNNGSNVLDATAEITHIANLNHFGGFSSATKTKDFAVDQVKGAMIDKATEQMSEYATNKMGKEALGKTLGYIPVVGDVGSFVMDTAQEYYEIKEDIEFVEKQYKFTKDTNTYSDYYCSANVVEYKIKDADDYQVAYAYKGEFTQDRIDSVNKKFNFNTSLEEVVNNPGAVEQKKLDLIETDYANKELYAEAIDIGRGE